MIEFDVDMGYLLEAGELDCVILNDENGEYEPMKFTPELGSGTCIVTHDFKCSNCGKQIGVVRNCEMYETCDGRQAWKSLDHEVCDIPNFCSNCGAKVVG